MNFEAERITLSSLFNCHLPFVSADSDISCRLRFNLFLSPLRFRVSIAVFLLHLVPVFLFLLH